MDLKQTLSWKFLIPIGILTWIVFYGGAFQIVGSLMTIFGIFDLIKSFTNKQKPENKE